MPIIQSSSRIIRGKRSSPPDPYINNVALFLKGDQNSLIASTITTSNFTVPAVNSTVTINVSDSASLAINKAIRIASGAGNYIITAIPNSTQITVRNCGGTDNAAAGTTINSSANITLSVVDRSISPKNITAFGNTQINTFSERNCIFFDGVDDYLEIAGIDLVGINTQPFTVEALVNIQSIPFTYSCILGNLGFSAGSGGHFVVLGDGRIYYETTGASVTAISDAGVTLNQFVHIAFSRTGNTMYLSIEGVTISRTLSSSTLTFSNEGDFRSGANRRNDSFKANLNGYIEKLRLTIGICRYTGDFNPNTDTYLN